MLYALSIHVVLFFHSLAAQRVARAEYEEGRAQIAARWGWLAAQISDLDQRIRIQHDVIVRQRSMRRPFRFPHQHPGRRSSVSSVNSQSSTISTDGESAQVHSSVPATSKPSSGEHAARTQPLPHLSRRRLLRFPTPATKTLDQPAPGGQATWYDHCYDPAAAPKASKTSHQPTIMEQLDRSYHPVLSFHSGMFTHRVMLLCIVMCTWYQSVRNIMQLVLLQEVFLCPSFSGAAVGYFVLFFRPCWAISFFQLVDGLKFKGFAF